MGRVSPFGNPRIKDRSHLPAAYRRVPRPSSPLGAKASTKCPSHTCRLEITSCTGTSPPKRENQTPPMPLAQQLAVVTQCHRPERPVRPLTEPSHQSERRPIQQTTHRLSGMRPMDARSSSPSQRTGPWNQGPMATTQTRVFQDRRPRGMPCRAWPVWWSRPGSNR